MVFIWGLMMHHLKSHYKREELILSKKYILTEQRIQEAISKAELPPYSLINDSMTYRAGYVKALLDLGLIDGLSASRMLKHIEQMEGWEK